MARSNFNPLLYGFSGRIGNVVVKRYGDKTVLSAVPDMGNRKLSNAQKQTLDLMAPANRYARRITRNAAWKQEACLHYNTPSNRIYRLLVREFIVHKGEADKLFRGEEMYGGLIIK